MPRKKKAPTSPVETSARRPSERAYPDLSAALEQLKARRPVAPDASRPVIDKWIGELTELQHEMAHLEKIERFSGAITAHTRRTTGVDHE